MGERTERYEKIAKLAVDEVNSVDKINSALELGMRMRKFDPGVVGAFGLGCGDGCDAWGLWCGNNCLRGLDPTERMISARYAIDVLGKEGIKMAAIGEDFEAFSKAVTMEVKQRLSLEQMEKRIEKYCR